MYDFVCRDIIYVVVIVICYDSSTTYITYYTSRRLLPVRSRDRKPGSFCDDFVISTHVVVTEM